MHSQSLNGLSTSACAPTTRRRWMHVGPAPKEWAKVQSGRFCGSLYVVVTKQQISPTGDRFGLLASGKRPPTAREVDVCRTSNWQCPETVRKPSANRPPGGRLPDDFRTTSGRWPIASAPSRAQPYFNPEGCYNFSSTLPIWSTAGGVWLEWTRTEHHALRAARRVCGPPKPR